jgi:hypothetical protein
MVILDFNRRIPAALKSAEITTATSPTKQPASMRDHKRDDSARCCTQ